MLGNYSSLEGSAHLAAVQLVSSKSLLHQSFPSSSSISSAAGTRQSLSPLPHSSKFACLLNTSILGKDRRDEGSEAHASIVSRTTSVPSSFSAIAASKNVSDVVLL